jgi:hypothetical protein
VDCRSGRGAIYNSRFRGSFEPFACPTDGFGAQEIFLLATESRPSWTYANVKARPRAASSRRERFSTSLYKTSSVAPCGAVSNFAVSKIDLHAALRALRRAAFNWLLKN